MTKKIEFLAVLLAFVMQSMTMWSATLDVSPVYLFYYRNTPKLDGNPKPSKAPANNNLSLSIFFEEDNRLLIIYAPLGTTYNYYICDENEEIISQGTLDFCSSDNLIVDLGACQSGTYNLFVVYNGCTYSGIFKIG